MMDQQLSVLRVEVVPYTISTTMANGTCNCGSNKSGDQGSKCRKG